MVWAHRRTEHVTERNEGIKSPNVRSERTKTLDF
jgi:hypothetical protein